MIKITCVLAGAFYSTLWSLCPINEARLRPKKLRPQALPDKVKTAKQPVFL